MCLRALRPSVAIALVALIAVLSAREAGAQAGRLTGRVLDAESREPIRGATVTADNPEAIPDNFIAVSDNRGRFAMLGLRSGSWAVIVAAPGYVPFRIPMAIRTLGNPRGFQARQDTGKGQSAREYRHEGCAEGLASRAIAFACASGPMKPFRPTARCFRNSLSSIHLHSHALTA